MSEKLLSILVAAVCAFVFIMVLVQPAIEKETFNKYKSESQPEATYFDAMFSRLRISTE